MQIYRESAGWKRCCAFDDNAQMVTGPVLLNTPRNAFERFQALDVAGLAMITGFRHSEGLYLANGVIWLFANQPLIRWVDF
jgi:hypothetical protein